MSTRLRFIAALGVLAGIGLVFACGSDAGDSDFGNSSGTTSSGSTGSSSGGFGSSGTTSSSGASGGDQDANPANCKAPIDMYIMFDRSGSMGNDCNVGDSTTSKWCRAINALSGYLKSPGAKDNAAALQFFPLTNHQKSLCSTGDQYNVANIPATSYETLPSNSFDAVLNATTPDNGGNGGTPTEAAIRGLTRFTDANRRAGHVTIGILITDGNPNGCNQDLGDLAQLLSDHNAATKVRTYVIGMTGADFANLETVAKGGGAPAHPDTVGTLTNACGGSGALGNGPCVHWNVGDGEPAAFQAALEAIQESADGCKDGGGFINPGPK